MAFAASLWFRARSETNRAAPGGRMATCPASPNCVSSLAQNPAQALEPLPLTADPRSDWHRLQQIVAAMPRTEVVVDEPDYLAAECKSRLFGFVDDLELQLDADAGIVHLRSASRVGHSDLGVNRRRVERIRALFGRAD